MTIIETWKDSLRLFWPSNFKLFLLVTLNAIAKAAKTVITQLWWLILIALASPLVVKWTFSLVSSSFVMSNKLVFSIAVLSAIFLLFILIASSLFLQIGIVLAARPSIVKKNISYFLGYWKYGVYILVLEIISDLTFSLLEFTVLTHQASYFFYLLEFTALTHQASYFFYLVVLFFVDDTATFVNLFKAIGRALKMVLYNLPFVALSIVAFRIFFKIMHYPEDFFNSHEITAVLYSLYAYLLLLIPICYFTNFYIKKIHDNFDLYFGKQ